MIKIILTQIVLNYFIFFAKLQLRKNTQAKIIGITGSAGKTSTRLAIVHILKERGAVKHSANANSETGIPLNILGLSPRNYSYFDWLRLMILAPLMLIFNWEHFDYYVVEMGIDGPNAPKNMTFLLKIIRPDIAVILNAGLAHAGAFDHLVVDNNASRRTAKLVSLIAKEKSKIVGSLSKSGVAIVNTDQPELKKEIKGLNSRLITIGKSTNVDIRILPRHRLRYQGVIYQLSLKDIFPDAFDYTFAAALAAGIALGITPARSIPQLASYRSPSGRSRIFTGIHDSHIIDSSYNASPATVQDALVLLSNQAQQFPRLAVIGDMQELGIAAKIAHKNLADWLLKYCDEAILFGDLVREHTYPVLRSQKFPVHHFDSMSKLIKYLKNHMKPKSWVLIKGSQNKILLERAVESILADKKDVTFLARRGKYWDSIRAKTA